MTDRALSSFCNLSVRVLLCWNSCRDFYNQVLKQVTKRSRALTELTTHIMHRATFKLNVHSTGVMLVLYAGLLRAQRTGRNRRAPDR
jgi:hypothetical protein